MSNAICMCTTSETYSQNLIDWKKNFIDENTYLIVDKTKNSNFNSNDFIYTESDIRKNLNFNQI